MSWQDGDCFVLGKGDEVSHVAAGFGNWRQYWMDHSGRRWPQRCQIHCCGKPATVGAHVRVKHLRQVFVLPTCRECSRDPEQEYGRGWASAKANALAVWVERHPNADY